MSSENESREWELRIRVAKSVGALEFFVRSMGLYMRDHQSIDSDAVAELKSSLSDIRDDLRKAIVLEKGGDT